LGALGTELEVVRRVGLVLERALGETGELAMVTVIEDGEVLAVSGETIGKAGTHESIGERIGGEGGSTLLAIGNNGMPGTFEILEGIDDRLFLSSVELLFGDLAGVVISICLLQLGRARERPD